MTASTALDLLRLFQRAGIEVWVDGGWGVDALLGEQTRPHADLDVVVLVADVPRARRLLAEAGFAVLREWLPTALAMRHPDGREVDLHPVTPTADGGGDQELFAPDPPFHYGPPGTSTARRWRASAPSRSCAPTRGTSRSRRTAPTCSRSRRASDCRCPRGTNPSPDDR